MPRQEGTSTKAFAKFYKLLVWSGRWSLLSSAAGKVIIVFISAEHPARLTSISIRTLGKYAGISRCSTIRALRELQDQGYIERVSQPGRRSAYRVHISNKMLISKIADEESLTSVTRNRMLEGNFASIKANRNAETKAAYLLSKLKNRKSLAWVLGMYPLDYAYEKMRMTVQGNGHIHNKVGAFLSACRSNLTMLKDEHIRRPTRRETAAHIKDVIPSLLKAMGGHDDEKQ